MFEHCALVELGLYRHPITRWPSNAVFFLDVIVGVLWLKPGVWISFKHNLKGIGL
jgi:hypothetical protein